MFTALPLPLKSVIPLKQAAKPVKYNVQRAAGEWLFCSLCGCRFQEYLSRSSLFFLTVAFFLILMKFFASPGPLFEMAVWLSCEISPLLHLVPLELHVS